ncbi:MAG: transposase [Chroococcidiopsidaceae cyanobacterium CP_BM_ER_R8_30]|nr:transposase [Chroococcidiopsidaceae cyanobacterium CP_BM_ER_R8_30]
MKTLEFKLKGKTEQFQIVDQAIRTAQFVRNKALRYWEDNSGVKPYDLNIYCSRLAKEFSWANKLNSQARQAAAERAAFAIVRFYENCKANKSGKKGYPKYKKNSRSVEYKNTGWKLASDRKHITFTDKQGLGTFKLVGTWDLHFYSYEQLRRVRILR